MQGLGIREWGLAVALVFGVVGCRVDPASDSPAADAVEAAGVDESAPATCELVPDDTITILQRPSPTADVFGEAAPGDTLHPTATAAGGWLGFDPAVAQAANVGPFRLRWVAPDGPFTLSGACLALPLIEAPTEGCYAMAGGTIPLRAEANTRALVVDSLGAGGFAPVVGRNGEWARVRLEDGREAWIAPEDGNFSGPCLM
jgi:hypothetical protein